ncbi:MAG: hypothetical protein M3Z30_06955 [Gemmatimonadota bacterium]|nr:hypothetical protein [Gemmatimonadota bacterium]
MPRFLRAALAVVVGLVVGSVVNMAIILISGRVIPPPAGADVTTMEGLRASLHLFEPRHFIFPFLAHAIGTLVGAFIATVLAPGRSVVPAYAVGFLFMLGGVSNVYLLPGPAWFNAVDILLAYFPAAWLGHTLANRFSQPRTNSVPMNS